MWQRTRLVTVKGLLARKKVWKGLEGQPQASTFTSLARRGKGEAPQALGHYRLRGELTTRRRRTTRARARVPAEMMPGAHGPILTSRRRVKKHVISGGIRG